MAFRYAPFLYCFLVYSFIFSFRQILFFGTTPDCTIPLCQLQCLNSKSSTFETPRPLGSPFLNKYLFDNGSKCP